MVFFTSLRNIRQTQSGLPLPRMGKERLKRVIFLCRKNVARGRESKRVGRCKKLGGVGLARRVPL